jgi:hypothetical protein
MIRATVGLLLLLANVSCQPGPITPETAQTCDEVSDLALQHIQELVDLADQVPFDRLVEEGLEALDRDEFIRLQDERFVLEDRRSELRCGFELIHRTDELTFETRSGEYFIEVMEGEQPPLP